MENVTFTELTFDEQEVLHGGNGYYPSPYSAPVNNVQSASSSDASASQAQGQGQQAQQQLLGFLLG